MQAGAIPVELAQCFSPLRDVREGRPLDVVFLRGGRLGHEEGVFRIRTDFQLVRGVPLLGLTLNLELRQALVARLLVCVPMRWVDLLELVGVVPCQDFPPQLVDRERAADSGLFVAEGIPIEHAGLEGLHDPLPLLGVQPVVLLSAELFGEEVICRAHRPVAVDVAGNVGVLRRPPRLQHLCSCAMPGLLRPSLPLLRGKRVALLFHRQPVVLLAEDVIVRDARPVGLDR
mmetsp:Transcript_2015/g.4852  ORF Transcript_2015/g.4852 Transcript_2015/m.4852 type:complete len:230 (-) Transcript_2015:167-856(-)